MFLQEVVLSLSYSDVISLSILDKPKINRTDLKNTSKTWLHRNSTFTCQADGNPSPVVSWSRGLKIAPGTGINSSSRIFVSPKSNEDFGFYNCTARNELGIDEFHMELKRSGNVACHSFLFFVLYPIFCAKILRETCWAALSVDDV